jgi:hypothetical protein
VVLPQIDEAFRRGDLSYSKVRALTRTATQGNETQLLAFALDASAAQCEDHCRRLRNGNAEAAAVDARRLHEGRSLVRHLHEDGSGTLTVELPAQALEVVLAALERVAARLPEDPSRSLFARGADALVEMARASLAGGNEASSSAESHQVLVHVEASALSGQGGDADLPLPTVKRLCCDGAVLPVVEHNGELLNVGRKHRTVPPAIKRALLARDRRCTWPGCHHERFLEAHHVHHWVDGGETSLTNLTLVCSHHHTLIHEGGFMVRRRADGSYYFARPDGRPLEVPSAGERALGGSSSAEDEGEVRELRAAYRIGNGRTWAQGRLAPNLLTSWGPEVRAHATSWRHGAVLCGLRGKHGGSLLRAGPHRRRS